MSQAYQKTNSRTPWPPAVSCYPHTTHADWCGSADCTWAEGPGTLLQATDSLQSQAETETSEAQAENVADTWGKFFSGLSHQNTKGKLNLTNTLKPLHVSHLLILRQIRQYSQAQKQWYGKYMFFC